MIIEIGNLPYKVLDLKHLHLGRGGAILQTKLKNLIEGNVIEKNFKSSDEIEEVEIEKIKLKFINSIKQTLKAFVINNTDVLYKRPPL